MGRYKIIDIAEVISSLEKGVSVLQIAEKMGVSDRTIYSRAKHAGWKFPKGHGGRGNRRTMKAPEDEKMCVCCGERPIPSKPYNNVILTRLCQRCYSEGEQYGEW